MSMKQGIVQLDLAVIDTTIVTKRVFRRAYAARKQPKDLAPTTPYLLQFGLEMIGSPSFQNGTSAAVEILRKDVGWRSAEYSMPSQPSRTRASTSPKTPHPQTQRATIVTRSLDSTLSRYDVGG